MLPLRELDSPLVSTSNETVPLPLPEDEPPVMWIHDWDVLADHEHPEGAVTVIVPDPPTKGSEFEFGEMLYEQLP